MPALAQVNQSSATSSPRGGSLSNSSGYNSSLSSATSYTPTHYGPIADSKYTASPEGASFPDRQSLHSRQDSAYATISYNDESFNSSMNVGPHSDVHAPHMATTHAYPPASTPMGHYSSYQPSSILQNGPQPPSYSNPSYPYQYGGMSNGGPAGHPVSSAMGTGMVPSLPPPLPLASTFASFLFLRSA